MQASWFRSVARALVCGVLISICSGLLEKRPEASIVESRYYGYPLVWRVTTISQPDEIRFANWAIDAVFWIALSSLFWLAAEKTEVQAKSWVQEGLNPFLNGAVSEFP